MAPKKGTHQENLQENDEANDKLHNLKSLDSKLLKEAVQRRHQVDSLMEAKASLESQLTRSNSDKERFRSELTQLGDEAIMLEVKNDLVLHFVGVQVPQQAEAIEKERDEFDREKAQMEEKMKSLEQDLDRALSEKGVIEKAKSEKDSEIEALNENLNGLLDEINKERSFSQRVSEERDEIMVELEAAKEEAERLRGKLSEAENRENEIKGKVKESELKYKGVVEEKEEKERMIESITSQKYAIEKSLGEANSVIQEMTGKIGAIAEEKQRIEEERNAETMKRFELESTVNALDERVSSLKEEEVRLRGNVAELLNNCNKGVDREKEMGRNIEELVREKKEREKRLVELDEGKGVVEKDLGETLKQMNEQKSKMEQLVNEKNELAEGKERKESEILGLQKKIREFEDAIQRLENSCKIHMEKVSNLESEIMQCKEALQKVSVERDEASKGYNEERQNVLASKEKLVEMEKSIEENVKLVEKMKAENANMTNVKEELERQCEALKKELSSAETTLTEIRDQCDALNLKLGDSDRMLRLLRGTAELVCSDNERSITNGAEKRMNGEEQTKPYLVDLEKIKNAFKRKEKKVEEMAQELESLQNTVAEAQEKSLWTMLSSATAVVATISVAAIAARRH